MTAAFVAWECASCGAELHTPRWAIPGDRSCDACGDKEPSIEPPAPAVEEYLAAAGVPARYRGLTLESWQAMARQGGTPTRLEAGGRELPIDALFGRLEGPALVVLSGLYGRGKTGAATALFRRLVDPATSRARRLWPAVWLDAAAFLARLQAGFADGTHHRRYRRAAEARLLLIDDLGAVQAIREDDWWRRQIAQLLREREAAETLTLITTNAAQVRDAMRVIDPTLRSRFERALVVRVEGPDRRKEASR